MVENYPNLFLLSFLLLRYFEVEFLTCGDWGRRGNLSNEVEVELLAIEVCLSHLDANLVAK